tara:strand:+ start:88 stop:282 length:195 start_codon:yes stop_codon:yes gene_type:complete
MGTKDPKNKPLVEGDMEEFVAMQARRDSKKAEKASSKKGGVFFECAKTIFSKLYPKKPKKTWTM